MGVAVNLRPVYNAAMHYLSELKDTCNIPKNFIDMILKIKAFTLSLKTGNFTTAIRLWNKFTTKVVSSKTGCGCNGTSV
jgi:hypothetical protein